MKSVSQSGTCRKRRGFITMELALTLPILGLMLLALLQFSMLFMPAVRLSKPAEPVPGLPVCRERLLTMSRPS